MAVSSCLSWELVLLLGCCLLYEVRGADDQKKWWQNTMIYEITPKSFYDSNADGYGDLKGITQKVGYLKELGVGAVWINPFYKSPGKDNGWDVSDYREIDTRLGTMKDFEEMLQTLRANNIELIMDFIPNHTSDEHEWFKKSVQKVDPYTDYYVWKDPSMWNGKKPVYPNNWASMERSNRPGSAWEWNKDRRQYYFHNFDKSEPELDLRNPKVVQELKDILQFWMEKGVKGFRFDAVPYLFEDPLLNNESPWTKEFTENLPESYKFIQEFRAFLDAWGEKQRVDTFMMVDASRSAVEKVLPYYGEVNKPGAHFPFNYAFLDVTGQTKAQTLNETISLILKKLAKWQHPNWASGTHDTTRIFSRMDSMAAVDIINALTLLLPGTAIVYMGDEIGMNSYWVMDKEDCPEYPFNSKMPHRTPFQWSTAKNAGFTAADKPWLPVNDDYFVTNVAVERTAPKSSHLKNFKTLMQLRKRPSFYEGSFVTYVFDDDVFAFTRQHRSSFYVVLINLRKSTSRPFNLQNKIPAIKGATLLGIPLVGVSAAGECSDWVACGKKLTEGDYELPPKSVMVLYFWLPQQLGRTKSKRTGPMLPSLPNLPNLPNLPKLPNLPTP